MKCEGEVWADFIEPRRSVGGLYRAVSLSWDTRRRGAGGRRRELYRVVEICPGAGALRYKSVPSQLYNQRSHDTWEHCAGATLIQTQPAETTRDRQTGISIILCMKKFKFEIIVVFIVDIFHLWSLLLCILRQVSAEQPINRRELAVGWVRSKHVGSHLYLYCKLTRIAINMCWKILFSSLHFECVMQGWNSLASTWSFTF